MSGAGSAAMIYLQNNVFDEALERLRMIFDGHDDVIVSMSGGKDSRRPRRFGRFAAAIPLAG